MPTSLAAARSPSGALEDYVYHQLCPGDGQPPRMTLAQAQALYEPDWYASYQRLGRPGATTGG